MTVNSNPMVSIVIPAFNQAHFLADALRSALAQTYSNFEIILVDDGSTDHTASVAADYKDQIRCIYQENQGLAGARNTGIRAARGEYVALLDSDDIWEASFLTSMMDLVQKQPAATIYYCGIKYIDQNKQSLPQTGGIKAIDESGFYRTLLRSNFLIPSTVVMKRVSIIEAGCFDVAFRRLQDWELWIRLLRAGHRFAWLNAYLVQYRVHGENLSTDPAGGQQAARNLFEKHFGQDDGSYADWIEEKRFAYGGLYRYCLLSAVQRQDDWQAAIEFLRKALMCDAELATDTSLFYDLTLGSQPAGFRGSPHVLNLEHNAVQIERLLLEAFQMPQGASIQALRAKACGTAYKALGLVAYNTNRRSASRRYFIKALRFYPALWRDRQVTGTIIRSLLSPSMIGTLKKFSGRQRGSAAR